MTDYYQPPQQLQMPLQTPEGEPIYLGPYTMQQAPYLICSNCGQPITVGQELLPDMNTKTLGITHSGKLIYVSTPSQEDVAPVHADCSSEYAHDNITHEPCGQEDAEYYCAGCDSKLGGEDG